MGGNKWEYVTAPSFLAIYLDYKGSESRGHGETMGVQIYKREAEI